MFFSIELLVFVIERLKDRFDHEKDRIAHGRTITDDLFKRLTRVIQSGSIFFKDRRERKIEDRKIKFLIPNPGAKDGLL